MMLLAVKPATSNSVTEVYLTARQHRPGNKLQSSGVHTNPGFVSTACPRSRLSFVLFVRFTIYRSSLFLC